MVCLRFHLALCLQQIEQFEIGKQAFHLGNDLRVVNIAWLLLGKTLVELMVVWVEGDWVAGLTLKSDGSRVHKSTLKSDWGFLLLLGWLLG